MAWRYCRDRGRAEEMAQEAFLRAWRGLAQWRRESSFSYLAVCPGRQRLPLRVEALSHRDAAAGGRAGTCRPASQLNELEEQRRHEALQRAVLALPMRYREPVILYYFS